MRRLARAGASRPRTVRPSINLLFQGHYVSGTTLYINKDESIHLIFIIQDIAFAKIYRENYFIIDIVNHMSVGQKVTSTINAKT
jgi:hypothetical protein